MTDMPRALCVTSTAPARKLVLSEQKKAWYNTTVPQSTRRLTLVRLSGGGTLTEGDNSPRSTAASAQKAVRLGVWSVATTSMPKILT